MRRGWSVLLVLAAACGSKTEDKPLPQTSKDLPPEAPVDASPLAIDPSLPPMGPPAPPPDPGSGGSMAAPRAPITIAGQCLQESETMFVRSEGDDVQACVDSDQDGDVDRCARWWKSTGLFRGFADVSDQKAPFERIEFGENEDDRLELIDPQIEVCPPDRICVKLMPKLPDDGEVTGMAADPAYRTLAVAMRDGSSTSGHIELWDLVAGRARNKVKLRKLEDDTEYTFDARFVGTTLIAVASRTDNELGQGVIADANGNIRGELANGSRFLDMDSIFELTPGTLAILDLEAPGVPYAVYTQSATSGRILRKFVVQMDMDGDDDDSHMHKVSTTMLAVTQWSTELRVDLIDLSTGKQTTMRVPSC